METKVCTSCGRELTLDNFKVGRWGVVNVCSECEKRHRREKKAMRLQAEKDKLNDQRAANRQLAISDFTPRELMQELARRGYTGKLQFTRVEKAASSPPRGSA